LINAFVGGMVGIERTVVPLIGAEEFHLSSTTLIATRENRSDARRRSMPVNYSAEESMDRLGDRP
jgi:hypothetical protein